MSLSIRTIVLRRRSKASRMTATADRSPETAARAAIWDTLATIEVACDWSLDAALIGSLGPIFQPIRQPVIAYVLATPFSTTQRSEICGAWPGMDENFASP